MGINFLKENYGEGVTPHKLSLFYEDVHHFLVPILRAHLFSGELLEFFATLCRENIDFQII